MKLSLLDATISAIGTAISASGTEFLVISIIVVFGITPQMCNRVTNPSDMGTFFRPAVKGRDMKIKITFAQCMCRTRNGLLEGIFKKMK